MKRIRLFLAMAMLQPILWTSAPSAQVAFEAVQADKLPAFEIASVRRSPPLPGGFVFPRVVVYPGGRLVAQLAPLRLLLTTIYPEYSAPGLIVGAPPWADTERFDIETRAQGNPPRDRVLLMARRLLADRFNLKAHVEPREIDVYAIVRANPDGSLGRGLRPAVDCEASPADQPAFFAAHAETTGGRPPCGFVPTSENGIPKLSAGGAPFSSLIPQIQMMLDRPVVDRTGLDGVFAIEFSPLTDSRSFTADTGFPTAAAVTGTGPQVQIFTAVREQLGLRLEARRERLEVLVIDHVEIPTVE